jgi:hypothetical protein
MGHLGPLVASSLACMAKYLVKIETCRILSTRHNQPSRLYLVTAGTESSAKILEA